MERIKNGFSVLIAVCFTVVLMLMGCPAADNGGNGGAAFTGVIFDEATGVGFAAPAYWNGDNGFAIGNDTTVAKGGTTSLKVDWSAVADWNAVAFNLGSGTTASGTTDLSGYDALTFQARASAETVIDKFGFAAEDTTAYEVYIAEQTITTTWTKYTIPLPNPAMLTAVNNMFYASDGTGATIWLDDIKFETLGTVSVKSLDLIKNSVSMAPTTTNAITVTAVFTVDDTDVTNVGAENLAAYITWVSNKPTVATVNKEGVITGESSGTATITGSLGDKNVIVNVTVSQDNAFTGTLFDDALQGGFTARKNLGPNGTESDAEIDSAVFAGVSGSAIKFDLGDAAVWGGGFLLNTNGADASSYTLLSFAINQSQLDASVDYMEFKLEDTENRSSSVNLYSLKPTFTEGNWNIYTIDLNASVTDVDFSKFKAIGFWHPKAGGSEGTFKPGVFYVDVIQFSNDGTEPATYTVTYDGNGGDGGSLSKTSDTVNDGSTISDAPTGITKTDYTLSAWNTKEDGSGTDFIFGTTSVTSDITLYARWTIPVADSVDSRYYFLGDTVGVGTPEIDSSGMTHYGGYDGTITFTEVETGGADGTSNYYTLVGTGVAAWAAGGWGNGPRINFAGYDTLVFWAKAPTTPEDGKVAATQIKFFPSSFTETYGNVGAPIKTVPDGVFTTDWVKYEIPLTFFTENINDFSQESIYEFKYELLGNNHELHIDEFYLRSNGNAPAIAVSADSTLAKDMDENPEASALIQNILSVTTVTAGASLSYAITTQAPTGAMAIDSTTGILTVADAALFVIANPQLTATVQVTASDGTTDVTTDIEVTVNINQNKAPLDAPPEPTATAADVINLFSDTYISTAAKQITGVNWEPGWGQATVYSQETIAGNIVKKYSNLNYQGIVFSNEDISSKTKVHFDLWTADETEFTFYLISLYPTQAPGISVETILFEEWNSYDLELSTFTDANSELDLENISQIKIEGSGIKGSEGKTVYLDNIYFH